MNDNPYKLTTDPTPKELARVEFAQQVLEDLYEHHTRIAGPFVPAQQTGLLQMHHAARAVLVPGPTWWKPHLQRAQGARLR
jgi:hypothetical protein